jgi:branched-chain amino acid transport system permease protein
MNYILSIVTLACINMVAVLGVAVFTGFTGLFSLGHAAFVGIGAYTSAILTYYYDAPFAPSLVAGMIVAACVSLIIGIPTLKAKLRSDYFAIAILGFGEGLRVLLENLEITNGARGLPGIEPHTTLPAVLLALALSIWGVRNFLTSRWGSACIAIREDPVAAEMAGVNLFRTRLLSLLVSAALCGLSGGLLAHYLSFIQPVMFTLVQSTMLLATVIAGGMGSISGPLLASFIFIALPEALRVAQIWRLVAYGLVLVTIVVYRPQGLMGYTELPAVLRKVFAPGKSSAPFSTTPSSPRERSTEAVPKTAATPSPSCEGEKPPLLRLEHLTKNFGGIRAVDDLSLSVPEGAVYGIIGPNGAGKTTVFNLITRVYRPDEGVILFRERSLLGLAPDAIVHEGIARTFQNIRLFNRQSCLENVLTPLRQRAPYGVASAILHLPSVGRAERELKARAMELLTEMELAAYADAPAATLPYGLQRKLEIARALAMGPSLLLLDEPAAGMNPEETRALSAHIQEIHRRFSLTILVIEHHMDLIMRICSRIAVINFGALLAEGTPEEIRKDERVLEAYLGKGKSDHAA